MANILGISSRLDQIEIIFTKMRGGEGAFPHFYEGVALGSIESSQQRRWRQVRGRGRDVYIPDQGARELEREVGLRYLNRSQATSYKKSWRGSECGGRWKHPGFGHIGSRQNSREGSPAVY